MNVGVQTLELGDLRDKPGGFLTEFQTPDNQLCFRRCGGIRPRPKTRRE
jgi:hypothetical protein